MLANVTTPAKWFFFFGVTPQDLACKWLCTQNFAKKWNSKFKKLKWFWRFSIAGSEEEKNCQIFILGFQCVAKIYNDNQRFFYFTFGMIATLAINKNSKEMKGPKILATFHHIKNHFSRSVVRMRNFCATFACNA